MYREPPYTAKKTAEYLYSYYECKYHTHTDTDHGVSQIRCPVCKSLKYDSYTQGRKECFPDNRINISGMLWWAKKCTISGAHDHHSCYKCLANWICYHRFEPTPPKKYI